MRSRRIAVAVVLGLAVLFVPGAAWAKSYTLPEARVEVKIQPDGSVDVTEYLTYSFSGSFSGGYRDIPLRRGEKISNISVSEGPISYTPGAPTAIGSRGVPHSFGTTFIPEGMRIVWHYSALDENKTFTVRYRLHNFVALYDDVADLNMKVWGDEWTVDLDHLSAEVTLPASSDDVRVWGHVRVPPLAGGVNPDPEGSGAHLGADHVAAGNWVEMRVVFPGDVLSPQAGEVRRIPGPGLPQILREERTFADQYEDQLAEIRKDQERLELITSNIGWVVLAGLAAALLPAAAIAYLIFRRFGRADVSPWCRRSPSTSWNRRGPNLRRLLRRYSSRRGTGPLETRSRRPCST
jgi:hypothetical protein